MPRGDRTGPWGAGPMTGRGAGYCAGYGGPGYANPGLGPGFGRGMGFGRGARGGGWGYRHWFYATGVPGQARAGYAPPDGPYAAPPTQEAEAEILEDQISALRGELEAVERRLAELRPQAGDQEVQGG